MNPRLTSTATEQCYLNYLTEYSTMDQRQGNFWKGLQFYPNLQTLFPDHSPIPVMLYVKYSKNKYLDSFSNWKLFGLNKLLDWLGNNVI